MDNKCTPKNIKLLVTILDRGNGIKLSSILKEDDNVKFNLIILGKGTANSEILNYLGLGEIEKDIVLSIVHEDNINSILKKLNERFHLKEPGNGIAFTIPLSSVGSFKMLEYICSFSEGRE